MMSNPYELRAGLLHTAKEMLEREQDIYAHAFWQAEQKLREYIDNLKGIWVTPANADYQRLKELVNELAAHKPKPISTTEIIARAEELYEFVCRK